MLYSVLKIPVAHVYRLITVTVSFPDDGNMNHSLPFCPATAVAQRRVKKAVGKRPTSIGMASSEVSLPTCGVVIANLSFHDRTYPTVLSRTFAPM